MNNHLQNKINDYAQWCEMALQHFENGFYEDALTNMRKSGEAACKLMIIEKFNERLAQEKISGKSYIELIRIIVNYGIATRSVINWLEALQIHGNIATHDNRVRKEQAEYSMTALRLLTHWLFEKQLEIAIPTKLDKALKQTSQPSITDDDSRQLEARLTRLQKDQEELQNKLQSVEGKTQEEADKAAQLEKQLEQAENQIMEMELLRRKAALLEMALAEAKEEKETQVETSVKKPIYIKTLLGVAATFVLLVVSWVIVDMYLLENNAVEYSNEQPIAEIDAANSNLLKVVIFPLTVLQDNPNIEIKFEEALHTRIRQRIAQRELPLSIRYISGFELKNLSLEEAIVAGRNEGADLVFYGEMYEPGGTDSTQVNVKYTLTRESNLVSNELGVQSFLKLTDSACIRIQQQVETVLDFALADRFMRQGKYSDALALLYATKPFNAGGVLSWHNFIAQCHQNLGDYSAAIKEMEMYIEADPENAYGYAFLANLLKLAPDYMRAKENYERALALEPNNPNTLLHYADLLGQKQFNNYHKARDLIVRALEIDSTIAIGWQYLGDIQITWKNPQIARKYYERSLSLDSTNANVKKSLAQVLAFDLGEPKAAEALLSEVLQKDSNDVRALFSLANIYTSTSLKNPILAEYLFSKSKKLYPEAKYSYHLGQGLATHQQGKLDSAVYHYHIAFSIDSTDIALSNYLAQAYLDKQDFASSIRQLEYSWQLDSMSHMTNYNLGFTYYVGAHEGVDLEKAKFYLERALLTNPYDTFNLEYLAAVHFSLGNIKRAEELLRDLLNLNPENFFGIKHMGMLIENKGKYKDAMKYYEKAMQLNRNDGDLYAKLALLLMRENTANIDRALHMAQKANELIPDDPDIMYILAQVLYYANDFHQSSNYYNRAISMKPSWKDAVLEEELAKKGY